MAESKLTAKQALFVEAYLGKAQGNATEAARLAGYKGNAHTLQVVGGENLSKPVIAAAVAVRMTTKKEAMSADEVIEELTAVASCDWKDFVQIRYGREGEIIDATLQLKDKLKALELLGKYHKLFTDKLEHAGPDGERLRVEIAYVDRPIDSGGDS